MKQYSVAIIENENGDVFLLRRSWSAPWGDFQWSLPGGEIEEGETAVKALIREINEELSIKITEQDCALILTIDETSELGNHKTFYYRVYSTDFTEDKIILNFENDKYQFLPKVDYEQLDLIPNLDVVFKFLCEKERFHFNAPTITLVDDLQKSFDTLLQRNPYEEVFEKGLDRSKLILKEITDKLGHHIKKWVRATSGQAAEKKPKQQESTKPEHSGIDYHSTYKDDSKLKAHAQAATPEQLVTFIHKEKNNPNAKRLIEHAQAELKSRGITEPSKDDNSPFSDSKKDEKVNANEEEGKQEEDKSEGKKLSKEGQEHIDLTGLADTSKDLLDYLPEVDKDANISDEEKQHIKEHVYKHIGKLTEKETSSKDDTKTLDKKEEKPEKKDVSDMDDEEKLKTIKGATKNPDGVYNPETGEGWNGDESLDKKHKQESDNIDNKVTTDIKNLIDPDTRVGALSMQEGPGGLGKTFTAIKELKAGGYDEIHIGDKDKRGDKSKKGFVHVKGGMTPTSLFEAMHDYPNAVFLIDDAKKIFESGEALEYIKAATDTSKQTVTRGIAGGGADKAENNKQKFTEQIENFKNDFKDLGDEVKKLQDARDPANESKINAKKKAMRTIQTNIRDKERQMKSLGDIRDKQFDFKGKVMMISNKFPTDNKKLNDEMYKPLQSRTTSGKITDLSMSNEAKLHKLSTLVPHFTGGKTADGKDIAPKDFKERKEVYDFVKKLVQEGRIDDISTRLLSGVYSQKVQQDKAGKNWKMELAKQYKKPDNNAVEKSINTDINIYEHLENLILGIN